MTRWHLSLVAARCALCREHIAEDMPAFFEVFQEEINCVISTARTSKRSKDSFDSLLDRLNWIWGSSRGALCFVNLLGVENWFRRDVCSIHQNVDA
jgi:hypothetical protein